MAASSAALTAQAENPTYVLGVPGAPTMYITPAAWGNGGGAASAEDNPWLAENNSYAAMSIAATTGEEAITLEDVYEPYLLQIGFLSRTPRGRCVTRLAYDHLGIPYRPNAAETQLTLE